MAFDLTDPIFHNEDAARAYFEVDPLAGWQARLPALRRDGRGDARSGQVASSRHVSVQRLPRAVHRDHRHLFERVPCPAP